MVYKRGSRDSSNSKGQVTVFIIIGIVILFTFAGVLFITKTVTKEKFLTEGEPLISRVPQAFAPLQLYTENCLNLISILSETIDYAIRGKTYEKRSDWGHSVAGVHYFRWQRFISVL